MADAFAFPAACPCEPLFFTRHYAEAIWGGDRIARQYARKDAPPVCSESWELSAHPSFPAEVECGKYAGARLDALASAFGAEFTGSAAPNPASFPLLFKIIDARERLSVQVHPDDASAPAVGGEAKSECWLVLDAAPGAAIYAGLVPGTTRSALEDAVRNGDPSPLLKRVEVKRGDLIYISGGTVHAIDAGCLVYEVQQSSDTTYRFYDWGRKGADGKPRTLHIDEGLAVTSFSSSAPEPVRASEGLRTPYFSIREHSVDAASQFSTEGRSFQAFFVESGEAEISAGGVSVRAPAGRTVLIPAKAESATVAPVSARSIVIRATL